MATLQPQQYEELKSELSIKPKFQSSIKNHTNKSYIAIQPTDTDENEDELSESTDTPKAQIMRLNTDLVELYSDDNGTQEKILIQKLVEFEGYNKNKCCYKCCKCLFKFRLILFIIAWLAIGLSLSYLIGTHHDEDTGEMIEAFVTDFALLLLCVLLGKILAIIILKTARKCVDNTASIFYIKDIYYRLFVTIVSGLWLIEDELIYNMFSVKLGPIMIAIAITSSVFLFTHILIRYVTLSRYFIRYFGKKTKQLRAATTFIKILLNSYDNKAPFNVSIINFMLDFPPEDRTKLHQHYVSFKFDIDRETDQDLYTIDLELGAEPKIIKDDKLKSLCGAVSTVIMEQLHKRKTEISSMPKYMNNITTHDSELEKRKSSWNKQKGKLNLLNTRNTNQESLALSKTHYSFHPDVSHLNDEFINEDIFMAIFKEYDQPNKSLLCELGQLAWKKFTNNGHYRHVNSTILKANVYKIMTDLLNLKQCINSYMDIINNLQLVTDIITPIVLLFVYLRLLGFDFSEAIAIYVSCFAIIGFFGSSYFSALFISMSFIVTTNPFLVGDYIMYENEVYLVNKISLLSCTFTQMSNRYSITFQNKQLSEASIPIINFTRSGKQKYKWTLFFKIYDIDDESIYEFVDAIKAKVKERIKYHCTDEKTLDKSFCTKEELEDIQWWSIKAKIYELDIFGRKKVKVQMKYFEYSSNVQTLCFNCITAVMKDFNIAAEPLPIFHNPITQNQ